MHGKQSIIDHVKNATGLTKQQATSAVEATLNTIQELAKTDRVTVIGFGTFKTVTKPARAGRNPQTGAAIQIPEKTVLSFKASK